MKKFISLMILIVLTAAGCGKNEGNSLPQDPVVAAQEAKAALASWQILLTEGKYEELIKVALPEKALEEITINDSIDPAFVKRVQSVATNLSNAFSEAQIIEPKIQKKSVVFDFPADFVSAKTFKDSEMSLTKTNGRWHFNGKKVNNFNN